MQRSGRRSPAELRRAGFISIPGFISAIIGRAGFIAAIAIPTAIAILATVPARAQELGEQPPGFSTGEPVSSFYTVDSRPVRARMSFQGSTRLQGIAPLTIPGDLTGPFLVKVESTGYEMQRGVLRFPGAGGPLEINPDDETGGVLLPALLWPGLGEIRRGQGDGLRGAGFAAAGGVGVSGVVVAELRRRDAEGNADRATSEQGNAPGLAERTALQIEAARETAVADRARAARRDWAIVSAAVWGLSLLDTYILTPRMEGAELAHNDLTLNLKPLSRRQAFMRSIVPGLGQYYTGRRTAGALYFFGGLAAGTVFLASEHQYSAAANRLAAVQALYDDPFADPESLALIRPVVEEETAKADDARKQRNLTAALAAGVWGANILDAVLATPSPPDDDQAGQSPTTRTGSRTSDLTFTLDLAQNPRVGMRCRFW